MATNRYSPITYRLAESAQRAAQEKRTQERLASWLTFWK